NGTKAKLKQNTGGNWVARPENFQNINLFGRDPSDVGALVVDPTNPNVVFVGGSTNFQRANDPPTHGIIRVDTGNMRDTTYRDNNVLSPTFNTFPNDGEDITKWNDAWSAPHTFTDMAGNVFTRNAGFYYDQNTSTTPYNGEGVYWYDLSQGTSGTSSNTQRLPAGINALAFDTQGRLLIGTQAGIYRGVSLGF